MAKASRIYRRVANDHTRQLPRLRRIEGQVRGLQQMIESERDCLDISHQISAVIAALRRVQSDMLCEHVTACAGAAMKGNISADEGRELAEEIGKAIARLS